MRTPIDYSDNLKKQIITTSMLEAALLSVNKRAKNYRDKEREYRHERGFYSDRSAASMAEKKEALYQKKESLLTIVKPLCIHAEFAGYEKVRVYNTKKGYENKYFRHFLHGTIVWQNSYYDWEWDKEVSFFDYIIPERPIYRYYLYYGVGNHTFHSPIKNPSAYDLPVKVIDTLKTSGNEINSLVSLQFVDKVLELVNQKEFKYVEDIETVLPEYPEYKKDVLQLQTPDWIQIWNCISESLKEEALKMPHQIRPLTKEEVEKITIQQNNKKVKGRLKWKHPKIKCPEFRLKCPNMSQELRTYIEENYKEEMGIREFSRMILNSPISLKIQECVESYYSMMAYCEILQKKADKLYNASPSQILLKDVYEAVESCGHETINGKSTLQDIKLVVQNCRTDIEHKKGMVPYVIR